MKHEEAGRHWTDNAEVWTRLSRAGYDVYRDHLNTPAFLDLLPDVDNFRGLDIGCGEGHNTRLLARRGARLDAIDIAPAFIEYARQSENDEPLGIDYTVGSAVALPYGDATFDFAVVFMSLMDIPDTSRVLAEALRVVKPGGFFQFSIAHPCFATPHRRNLRDSSGLTYAFELGDYFRNLQGDIEEWIFGAAPADVLDGLRPFRIPRFTHTLSQWLNLLTEVGFILERVEEPRPSDEAVRACPRIQDAQVVAYFLHVRARRPAR